MRLAGFALAALVIAAGCRHAPPASSSSPVAAPAREGRNAALLRQAGDRAAFVLVVNPQRWREAQAERERIARFFHRNDLDLSGNDDSALPINALQAADPWSAVAALLALSPSEIPAGFDPDRPIGLGLLEADSLTLGAVGRALLVGPLAEFVPLVRHRVLLPARDAAALAGAVADRMVKAGYATLPAGPEGPRAFRRGDHAFAVVPEGDLVRIEIVIGRVAPDPAPEIEKPEEIPEWLKKKPGAEEGKMGRRPGARPAPPPPPRPAPPPPTVSMRWLDVLGERPSTAPLPGTAALRFAAESDDLFVLHIRPHRFPDAARVDGARHTANGIVGVDPSMKATLALKATSEIASGALVLTQPIAFVGDVALGLSPRRIAAVVALTAAGKAKWQAAASGARLPAFAPGAAEIRARVPVSLGALVPDPGPSPPGTPDLRQMREAIEMRHECGWMCFVGPIFTDPLSFAAPMLRGIPRASSVNGLALGVLGGSRRMRVALAVELPVDADARGMAAAFFGRTARLNMNVKAAPAGQLLEVGIGVEPKDVFLDEPGDALPAGTLADFELSAAPDAAPGDAAEVPDSHDRLDDRDLLQPLRPARGRLRVTASALVAEIHLGERPEGPAPFALAPDGALASAPSASPGAACLLDAVRIIREGFGAVAGVDHSDKRMITQGTTEKSRAPLACAAADPATQAEARALDDLLQRVPAALEEQAKAE